MSPLSHLVDTCSQGALTSQRCMSQAAGQLESVADCARLSPPNAALLEGTGYTVPAELGPDRLRQAAAGLRTLLQAKDAGNRCSCL